MAGIIEFADSMDESTHDSFFEKLNLKFPAQKEQKPVTPVHVQRERRRRKVRERLAADPRLHPSVASIAGSSGSPVSTRVEKKDKEETQKCPFDCTTQPELPGLNAEEESEEAADIKALAELDWRNPANRSKFEKVAKRRLSRSFNESPIIKRTRQHQWSPNSQIQNVKPVFQSTPRRKAKNDSFSDDSFEEAVAAQIQRQNLNKKEDEVKAEVKVESEVEPEQEEKAESTHNGSDEFSDDTLFDEAVAATQAKSDSLPKPSLSPKNPETSAVDESWEDWD